MRRKIGIKEIEDMALGATVLGAGGGGDPYVGKLMAIEAIKKYGEVELISPDEVPDDAVVCVSQMMGAPTIMVEKICSGLEPMATYDELVKRSYGQEPYAIYAVEAGGVNSTMLPIAAAARPHSHGGLRSHGPRVPRAADGHVGHHRRRVGHAHGVHREGQTVRSARSTTSGSSASRARPP